VVIVTIPALLIVLLRLPVFVFNFKILALILEVLLVLNRWWGSSIDIDIRSLLTRREIIDLRRKGSVTSLSVCLVVAITHGVPVATY
jgi:hypothetical protein